MHSASDARIANACFCGRSQNFFFRLGTDQFSEIGYSIIYNRVKFQLPNLIMLGERVSSRSPEKVDFGRFWGSSERRHLELESEAGTILDRLSDLENVEVD